MNKLLFLLLIVTLIIQSCKSTNKKIVKHEDKINKQNEKIYTEPDYNRLGYSEVEFTGEGSQAEMNNIVYVNLERAEKRLETILDSIHILYNQEGVFGKPELNEAFFKSLELSQKQWLSYYETMIALKFPKEDEYGSSSGMSIASYKRELIDNRIRNLNPWLMGIPQGDISGGSIRTLEYSWNDINESTERAK